MPGTVEKCGDFRLTIKFQIQLALKPNFNHIKLKKTK
jgi:hypothetical protein